LQAAVLDVKLRHLNSFTEARQTAAQYYDKELSSLSGVCIPVRSPFSTHVYHQYTLQVKNGRRDALQAFLKEKGIPSMVYYPMAVQEQEAYKWIARTSGDMTESVRLSREVLSLPMHTELTEEMQAYTTEQIREFFQVVQ
jgi:Predicted pyridoxal phosphate-dependent enzyme apparently involved in regulation of cell wall biogenesis